MLAGSHQQWPVCIADIAFTVYVLIFPPLEVEFDEFELLTLVTATHFFSTVPNNEKNQNHCYYRENYFNKNVPMIKAV